MFIGEYRHNLDSKNRLIIPAKFRDQLPTSVYVTEWMNDCLAVYTEDKWLKMVEKLMKLPETSANSRAYIRHVSGKADECSIDGQGRILLPAFQIRDAGLKKGCVIVGAVDHFEIWAEDKYDNYDENVKDNFSDIAESLTEFLK